MGKITGVVTKVTKGKGIVELGTGTYERLNMTIKGDDGELVIQKLVKPGNDGSNLLNQRVQADYEERELTNQKGEKFTARSVNSKGFVLLDAPKFTGRGQSTAKTVTNTPASSGTSSTVVKTGTYSSEGARHGMIVGNAIELAIARLQLDQAGLFKAASDVTALTKFVESGAILEAKEEKAFTSNTSRGKTAEVSYDEEDPFSDLA
jgi:hypothetical protein